MSLARAGKRRLVLGVRIDLVDRPPERRQRRALAGVVPYARRDDPASSRHPPHLGQARHGVVHEVDDELPQRRVEGAVAEGQVLGAREPDLDAGMTLARGVDERARRVDGGHATGAEPGDELGGQRARAAAHVERAVAVMDLGEVGQLRRKLARVGAHEAVVGVGGDVEGHAGTLYAGAMCRNIRPLFNFEPPASDEEVRDAALQFVRKISGFTKPSQANAEAFERAVDEVAAASTRLLAELTTSAPAKDRDVEAAKARARSAQRYAA